MTRLETVLLAVTATFLVAVTAAVLIVLVLFFGASALLEIVAHSLEESSTS